MSYEEVEKNCTELIKKMIDDTAGTKDFAVTYTVWYPISEFILSDTECGRKSAGVEVVIGTAVHEQYGSYRRMVLKVSEILEKVLAPVLGQGKGKLRCEGITNGVSIQFVSE